MMSAAPTSGFAECTPGEPETCYDNVPSYMRGRLEGLGRGLTCEESCIVTGGLWCNALGLNGCVSFESIGGPGRVQQSASARGIRPWL